MGRVGVLTVSWCPVRAGGGSGSGRGADGVPLEPRVGVGRAGVLTVSQYHSSEEGEPGLPGFSVSDKKGSIRSPWT